MDVCLPKYPVSYGLRGIIFVHMSIIIEILFEFNS